MMRQRPSHPGARQRGLTFVELLLGLTITALIGAAIASMFSAVAYGTQESKNIRSLVIRDKVIGARMSAAIRQSNMVLDQGDDFIVLWRNDDNASGAPDLAELQRIELYGTTNSIRSFEVPSTLTGDALAAINTAYELTDDFGSATASERGQSHFPAEVWATSINSWTLTLNSGDAQSATLISFRVNLQQGDLADTLAGAASLKNRASIGGTGGASVVAGDDDDDDDTPDDTPPPDDDDDSGDDSGDDDSDDDDDDDGPTYICTELHRQGLMSDDIYALDARYGRRLRAIDPSLFRGYAAWAPQWVQVMRRDDVIGKVATHVTAAAALPWARAMAAQEDASRERDRLGEWVIHLGYPAMRALGDSIAQDEAASQPDEPAPAPR